MIKFIKSNSIKIKLDKKDWDNIPSEKTISKVIEKENIFAFDILNENNEVIGFTMLRKFEENSYFLWEFAIDKNFQGKGLGKKSLEELISFLRKEYNLKILTTTYIFGNEKAKKLYENLGFKKISIIEEDGVHEVDMLLNIKKDEKLNFLEK